MDLASPAVTPAPRPSRAPATAVLGIACAAIIPVLMNYTTPLITLPPTARGVGAGAAAQTWILNASPLGLAAALLVSGTLADNFGRRRLMIIGALGTALGSALAAVAADPATLIAGRVLQGATGAAIIASSLGAIGHTFTEPSARARATGLWATALSTGLVLGPIVSGLLTVSVSWRAAYWVFAALGVVLAAAATRLPESRAARRRPVHYGGIVTAVTAMAALLAALTLARTGWTQPSVVVLAVVTALAVAGFAVLSRRHHAPMVDLHLFRHRPFLLSIAGSGLNGLIMIGVLSAVPTAWENTHRFGALFVGAVFVSYPLLAMVTARLSRYLRLSSNRQLALGYAIHIGQLFLLGTVDHWSLPHAIAGFGIAGIGCGLVNSANARMAVDSVPAERASMGSGAANTARYVGSAVGLAVAVTVIGGAGWGAGVDAMLIASAVLLALAAVAFASRSPRPA
ncbi:MAG TPA: MFS transporter [Stackebrandtia sp.]|uniref:MFS transporter n=1 Tax=Stackebrandtia sp. TaxID=2023065 RepID=UPI002D5A2A39|nr:MFS transporter [Stackebrandtia sp.]HZE37294.1 MFS transporter [Stackebrandtia sp.]